MTPYLIEIAIFVKSKPDVVERMFRVGDGKSSIVIRGPRCFLAVDGVITMGLDVASTYKFLNKFWRQYEFN